MSYVYDNADPLEQERLASLEANMDPPTFSVLTQIGVAAGWRCWEVGGGAGSVSRWLAERADAAGSGRVLATDVDLTLLEEHAGPGVEVRAHDVVSDPLPDEQFDLVHARLVLEHIPQRDDVLRRLASVLAPGGWLVVEDSVSVGISSIPPSPEAERFTAAIQAVTASSGWDTAYGARLVPALRELGLAPVRGRVHTGWNPPGEPWIAYRHTIRRLRERLVATGLVTGEELDALSAMLADEAADLTFVPGGVLSAWGRRP